MYGAARPSCNTASTHPSVKRSPWATRSRSRLGTFAAAAPTKNHARSKSVGGSSIPCVTRIFRDGRSGTRPPKRDGSVQANGVIGYARIAGDQLFVREDAGLPACAANQQHCRRAHHITSFPMPQRVLGYGIGINKTIATCSSNDRAGAERQRERSRVIRARCRRTHPGRASIGGNRRCRRWLRC